ncbi:sushi, von Willebrand factor type A, EGF and pentraxin domain-containing protein 1-like [Centruroides sculpturatus]|uniref:sushi, von Willebrand factor type A, EGF and pentraxin domain-containing protein 1-like n=1 Tax=Centruroides sculpturatus TaxID=218467 RepID=UPI000C6EDE14|nr:sushi, von Willebrand factor type A, EGF and pentraxin domain-containing protein 1-like [Centruroides sculpturatus]
MVLGILVLEQFIILILLVKACPPLNKPRHGSISCTTENFVFETECHFSCDPGYTLVGSKERTCLAIALWDGLPALCRSINCPSLSPLANGIITPSKCTQGKNKFGEICQFDCKEGFVLNGPSSKQCIDPGIWSSENIQSTCVDVQPPVIKCPENIVVDAEENEASALVKWEIPLAVDNSRDIPTISVIPAIIPPRRFHIGVSTITYIAEDKNKNKKACNFTVTVRDTQPPVVDKCVSPPTFLSREIPVDVSWEEPMFSDNSGGKVTIWRSHEPGYFSLGETSVIYEAHDEAGNNNTCIINIVVQEPHVARKLQVAYPCLRPISDKAMSPTKLLEKVVHNIASDHMRDYDLNVKRPKELIGLLRQTQVMDLAHITVCDFISLYPSIKLQLCFCALRDLLLTKFRTPTHHKQILEPAHLMCYNFIFQFNNRTNLQKCGDPWAACCLATYMRWYYVD